MRVPIFALLLTFIAFPARAQDAEAELETIRNYVRIDGQLATAGQIGLNQISALKEVGFDVVVNLATGDLARNGLEGFLAVQEGLTYIHIPVSWQEPSMRDLELFFDVMQANQDRKVFVHCFANMRASTFTYLYRTLVLGIPENEAMPAMSAVWDPTELQQWADLIERAQSR